MRQKAQLKQYFIKGNFSEGHNKGTTINDLGAEEIKKKNFGGPSPGKKLERLSEGKNTFISKSSFALPPQIINGRPQMVCCRLYMNRIDRVGNIIDILPYFKAFW